MTGTGRRRSTALTAGLALLLGVLGNPGLPVESRAAPVEGEASSGTSTPGGKGGGPAKEELGDGTDPAGGGAWTVWVGHPFIWINGDGRTEQIVCSPEGFEYVEATSEPDASTDGQVVAFAARFLLTGSTVTVVRIAIVDRRTGECLLAPPPPGPEREVIDPGRPDLDPGGRWVAWAQYCQVWVWVIGEEGGPALASGVAGQPAPGCASQPVVGPCGLVAFTSSAPTLVPNDTNGAQDVFVGSGLFTADPSDDGIQRISVNPDGSQRDGPTNNPSFGPDCETATQTTEKPETEGTGPDGDDGTGPDNDTDTDTETIITPEPTTDGFPPQPTTVIDGCGPGPVAISRTTMVCETGTEKPPGETPTNFSVVDKDGTRRWGIRIILWDGNRVRVAFPDTVKLDEATCGHVRQGAIIDQQVLPVDNADGRSNTNPPACVGPTDDVTEGPDLLDATVVQDDAGTPGDPADDLSRVRVCFDEALGTVTDPARFGITFYNSAVRVAATSVTVDPADPSCVVAAFPDHTDVDRATLVTVTDDAVTGTDGRPNVEDSTPLQGTRLDPRPGDITGPNLISAIPDLAMGTVTFTFDEMETASPGARFTFVDDQGDEHPADSVSAVSASQGKVVVAFTGNLGTARRFVALPDAVRNDGNEPNVEQSTDANVAGPELSAVTQVPPAPGDAPGPPRYDFTFNEAVRAADIGRLFLYTADGTRFPVTAATQPAPDVVRVTAPDLTGLEPTVVLGVAQARAVFAKLVTPTGAEVSGAPNPLGTRPVGRLTFTPSSPTDGPDLIDVVFLPDDHVVEYLFDEPVRDVHLMPETPGPTPPGTDTVVTNRDTGDRQEIPACANPTVSPDGRFVACDDGSGVIRNDTLVSQVNPDRVDFGQLPLGSPEATREVTVINRGFTPLVLSGVAVTGANDYRLTGDGCSGRTLEPRESCGIVVGFSPGDLGARDGTLSVTDNAPGSPHAVALAGAGPSLPTISSSPQLGSPGAGVIVRGGGFPAGATVELRWIRSPERPRDPAPLATTKVVRANAAGDLGPVSFLVLKGDVLGPRLLSATVMGAPLSATTPFLVVPGTSQPQGSGRSRTFGRD
ncbi:MAG: choice-of-anchor D domain-containing protein [Acidimicrobiia bacterium]